MKKEIYSSAWDNITMSDECFGEILDSIDDVPVITKHPRKKVSYLAIVTAAVVFMCGGITVAAQAGAFDWIKAFFAPDAITNAEEFSDIVGKMEDFECNSDTGAEFSPVGVIFDGDELYCMLKIDKLPKDMNNNECVILRDIKLNGSDPKDSDGEYYACSLSTEWVSEDGYNNTNNNITVPNMLALKANILGDNDLIKEGDRITLELGYRPDSTTAVADLSDDAEDNEVKISDVSFDLKGGRYSVFNIDYSKYTCDEIPKRQYDFILDTVKITSLKISAEGKGEFYGDVMTSDDMKVILDDGSEVIAKSSDSFSWGEGTVDEAKIQYLPTVKERVEARGESRDKIHTSSQWTFTKPIDPDRIIKIYLDDMCIYKKQ